MPSLPKKFRFSRSSTGSKSSNFKLKKLSDADIAEMLSISADERYAKEREYKSEIVDAYKFLISRVTGLDFRGVHSWDDGRRERARQRLVFHAERFKIQGNPPFFSLYEYLQRYSPSNEPIRETLLISHPAIQELMTDIQTLEAEVDRLDERVPARIEHSRLEYFDKRVTFIALQMLRIDILKRRHPPTTDKKEGRKHQKEMERANKSLKHVDREDWSRYEEVRGKLIGEEGPYHELGQYLSEDAQPPISEDRVGELVVALVEQLTALSTELE
jgi:hypothetical protein